tara:strand:- start:1105 stop:1872 length:768 start_codon:yes stop_codon:yes gene_type:complete
MLEIFAIPAFTDNYIWALRKEKQLVVVDPGDPNAVQDILLKENLDLIAILITHWHPDHTGGLLELSKEKAIPVYGPKGGHIEGITNELGENDQITILGNTFKVFETPGHTLDHISYFSDQENPILFCGDTLFSGGCGRLFEGTPTQMYNSLSKFSSLPEETKVFCTHEYTLSNLNFAVEVEPTNKELLKYYEEVSNKRNNNEITLPSNIKLEKNINPFLRSSESSIKKSAEKYSSKSNLDNIETLSVIRSWKDNF